jgi:gliding motility-associated-like protein
VILDTIVTTIIKDWRVVANTRNSDQLVKDAFEQQLGLYYNELPEEDIPFYLGDGTFGCLDTTGLSQFFTFGVRAWSEKVHENVFVSGDTRYRIDTTVIPNDTIEVAKVLHFRDSSIRGYDSLAIDTNFDGNPDMVHGVWRKDYRYPQIVVPDPCFPNIRDTLSLPANGPMIPSLFLNNTVGCEKRGANLLNVGFLNDYWLDNENICNGLRVNLSDSIRYWQYGEQFPEFYPIDPNDYWHDPARYLANREIFEGDWDSTDGVWDGERSLTLNHIYDEPGEYTITVVSKDSMNCYDTVFVTAYVSDLIPQIGLRDTFLNCNWIVNFNDSSIVIDPCALKDTCTTGVDLSCDSIVAWEWDFGDGTRTSILENPSHDYTQGGWFDVKLTVRSHLGCVDSVVRRIFIPGPQPEFEFENAAWNENDTAIICVGDSIDLLNLSGGLKISPEWEMDWGDGGKSNPSDSGTYYGHRYDSIGTFSLSLVQFDEIPGTSIRCNRIFPDTNPDLVTQRKIIVIVRPVEEVSISASKDTVCPNEIFTVLADVDSPYTKWQWVFTDLDTISQVDPHKDTTFSYSTTGLKDIRFIPTYDKVGREPVCSDTAEMQVYVTEVIADFTIDSTNRPEFCFTNTSTNASIFNWTFQDDPTETYATEENPCKDWQDRRGTWEICLAVESPEGCLDTTCKTINNTFFRTLIPYNVFTPDADLNGDGYNDVFKIDGEGLDMYNIKIYNRWGERVFESDDVDFSWNGKVNNTGTDCPEGTYFYIINYQFMLGEENEGLGPIEGTVTLERG